MTRSTLGDSVAVPAPGETAAMAATVTATGSPGAAAPRRETHPTVEVPPSLHARFEDFQLVGRGGMGAVFRARDLRLGRTVAVKLLFAEGAPGSLLREARSQARLRHPHVCEVYEAGLAEQTPFIVMRFVEGGPLSQLAPEMSLEQKVGALRDVALALHEAHRLGLIHRDVKPGNILVERGEDGVLCPYIADFGIARDLSRATLTHADSVQGTPAYMAPEQAAGKTRSLDRRTDVYGLGATLYDTLVGQPPFTATSVLALLKSVVETEPPPPREVLSTIPADLDAIVMKCLEKDPGARYPSAKALAEDLGRFLDGDPVEARRASWGARLSKRARKHKGKVAAATAVLAASLLVGGLWLRDRRIESERALLARDLSSAVREVELFLREAYSLPLHDVEREREVVKKQLGDIESRMAAAGPIGQGPGHDALGRGYLALQDPTAALEHFRLAREAGHEAPGLDYAMGRAHIELYRVALEKVSRIQKASEKAAYIAEIEREHKAPALFHLRAALTRGVESPAYAYGLVAFHEGRLEEALSRAQEAFAAAPWLHEAKRLEGDVLQAMGSETGSDRAFDYTRASGFFARAATAYAAAAEIARSDPSVHEAECTLWTKAMNAAGEHGDSMRPGFEKAKRACERAIAASPQRPSGHLKLAWAHNCFAFWVAAGHRDAEVPEKALADAEEHALAAAARSPDDAFASYVSGAVWRSQAIYAGETGRDTGPALERAIQGYEAALAIDPGFLWALNEECGVLTMRGEREARLGVDPAPTYEKALVRCGRAIELDPDFVPPRISAIIVHLSDAERLKAQGQSPAPAVERGVGLALAAEKQFPTWKWPPFLRATLHRVAAEYDATKGHSPDPMLARAEAALLPLSSAEEPFPEGDGARGEIAVVMAEWRLAQATEGGRALAPDPELEAALANARGAFGKARAETPWDVGYALWLSRVELVELRYRLALGRVTAAEVDAVLVPLTPFLAVPRDDPRLFEAAARGHEARAEARRRSGQDAGPEIAGCIAMAEKAVAVGPGIPSGGALRDRCLVLRGARGE